jgi:signal transduction histidine kinase
MRSIHRMADARRVGASYADEVDRDVVRRIPATIRPADWLMVASLLLLVWFEIWVEPIFQTGMPGPPVPLTLLATAALVPLLARRAFPLPVVVLMCLGLLGVGLVGEPHQSTFVLYLGLVVGMYSLAAEASNRDALIGAAVAFGSGVLFQLLASDVNQAPADVIMPMVFLAAPWVVGKEVHRQRQRAKELADHADLQGRAHQLELHAAVSAERTRIARELHDVVAHAISVMGIQAGAARSTLRREQGAQRDALLDVERLGREALVEMERMLGLLRTAEDDQGVGPVPDLAKIPALVEEARRVGLAVDLEQAGELDCLPAGLQLTVYRIVQEALTNVRKHAQAKGVRVSIERWGQELEVTVVDDGDGVPIEPTAGDGVPLEPTAGNGVPLEPTAGNGLIGMRERVALHGGTLYAGRGSEGGFLVRARLTVGASG